MPSAAPISSACPAPDGPAPIDFLQRDDVGVDLAQDFGDPHRRRPPIHAAAAVDVVGRDAEVDVAAAAAARSRRSLLALQDPDERPDDLLPQRPAPASASSVISSLSRRVAARSLPASAPATAASRSRDVDFVVVLEGSVVDVGRAEHRPEPSTIRTFACVIEPRYSWMRMPASSSCPHMRRLASRTQR